MKSRQHTRNNRVVGVMVSISAFQAGDMGSIPVPLNFFPLRRKCPTCRK